MNEKVLICLLFILGFPFLLFNLLKLILIWLFAGSKRLRFPKEPAFQHSNSDEYERLMETEIQQEIQRLMPVGTSVHQAKHIMRKNGFKCEWGQSESKRRGYSQLYLFCRRDDPGFLVYRSWIASFNYEHELITNIQAKTGLTGL